MAGNSRIVLLNYATQPGVVLKNGTGGGAPALDQDASGLYLMANAIQDDRESFWLTSSSPASPINLDIGLGTQRSVSCVWVSGILYTAAANDLATVTVTGHATTYSASEAGYSSRGTITIPAVTAQGMAPRDAGAIISALPTTYLRFKFNFRGGPAQFAIGKIGVGLAIDLGGYYSAGSTDDPVRYRTVSRTIGGHPEVIDYGLVGRAIDLKFDGISTLGGPTAGTQAALLSLAECRTSFMYIDPADNFYECILRDARVGNSRVFAASGLHNMSVPLERLP